MYYDACHDDRPGFRSLPAANLRVNPGPRRGSGGPGRGGWPAIARRLALGVAVLTFVGCDDLLSPGRENPEESLVFEDDYLSGPRGEPLEIVYTFPGTDTPVRLMAELVGDLVIIEGDIALGTRAEIAARAAPIGAGGDPIGFSHAAPALRWLDADGPNAQVPYTYEVPYEIDDGLLDSYVTANIEPAIEHWNNNTNLRLVPRNGEADYIRFVRHATRCWSKVGRQAGPQEIGLRDRAGTTSGGLPATAGCGQRSVIHEIGHAIGLKHEQQRSDRNQHVRILEDSIIESQMGNFDLYIAGTPVGPYNRRSIMHYGRRAFGKLNADGNSSITIESLTSEPIAPANVLTDLDIAAVRRMYPDRDPPFVEILAPGGVTTVNEGVQVGFEANVVAGIHLNLEDDVRISWTSRRVGAATTPFTFGLSRPGERITHTFCDGVYDVTASAALTQGGTLASEVVRVNVSDLGATNPPASCAVSVDIVEPIANATYVAGADIALRAVIDDDHPETSAPIYPVTWRIGNPTTGSIIGTSLQTSAKLTAGQRTIYVTYGSARDSVRINVAAAGTPPTAQITSPANNALFTWSQHGGPGAYIDVQFTGSATDTQDGSLTGSALVWAIRRQNQASFTQVPATGSPVTIRFPYYSEGNTTTFSYDVRLSATDSDGMVGSRTIQVRVQSPPN